MIVEFTFVLIVVHDSYIFYIVKQTKPISYSFISNTDQSLQAAFLSESFIIYNMAYRLSINQDIRSTRSIDQERMIVINFRRMIEKQRELIRSLQEEILLLKSYISIQSISCVDLSESSEQAKTLESKRLCSSIINEKYECFMHKLMDSLQLQDDKNIDEFAILSAIKELKQLLIKKSQPIFVERIKQIKVPITIEKIIEKPVDKIIQKIVYVDRPTVIFKEKIVEKFIERKEEPPLSTCLSQKTLKIQRQESQQPKYSNKNHPTDLNIRPDLGGNMVKKRDNHGKYYGTKKEYREKQFY